MAAVMAAPMRIASTLLISGKVVIRQRKYTELERIEADMMRRPICERLIRCIEQHWQIHTIQLSPLSLFTSHLVIWPAAWITSRLQNPSPIWKTGVLYLSILSQPPIVTLSRRPPGPNIHSYTLVSCALFPPKVRSTQPELLSASTENLFKLQMSRVGIISHCVHAIAFPSVQRNLLCSGVAMRSAE